MFSLYRAHLKKIRGCFFCLYSWSIETLGLWAGGFEMITWTLIEILYILTEWRHLMDCELQMSSRNYSYNVHCGLLHHFTSLCRNTASPSSLTQTNQTRSSLFWLQVLLLTPPNIPYWLRKTQIKYTNDQTAYLLSIIKQSKLRLQVKWRWYHVG